MLCCVLSFAPVTLQRDLPEEESPSRLNIRGPKRMIMMTLMRIHHTRRVKVSINVCWISVANMTNLYHLVKW